jgi:hypothetical protein
MSAENSLASLRFSLIGKHQQVNQGVACGLIERKEKFIGFIFDFG